MTAEQSFMKLKLRPHHVYCERFSTWNIPERGEAFNMVECKIRDIITSDVDTLIEVVEGVDELCEVCPLRQNDRCESPQGNEDEVRKWDEIILEGLGISYGDRFSAKSIRRLIDEKAPLPFCRTRCKLKEVCPVFQPK